MDRAFLLERREPARAALQGLAKEHERAVEVLKALSPSDIQVGRHVHVALLLRKE
jgi:hypothetical protein